MRAVALTLSCNNACVYCAQGELRANTLSEAAVEQAFASILPGDTVALVGGEPTLDPRLSERIREAHARGAARVIVQTNGRRLAYRAYVHELAAASERLSFDVSLAGSTEAMHDYHTAAPGSFKQTLQGLGNARAEGIPTAVSVVVTRSNFRHLVEVVRLVARLGARALRLVAAAPFGRAARALDRVVPAPELTRAYLAAAVEEARQLGLGVVVGDRAAPEDALGLFAGLGLVERVPSAPARSVPQRPARDGGTPPVRPAPGRGEVRAHARRTGTALDALFPELFCDPDDALASSGASAGAG